MGTLDFPSMKATDVMGLAAAFSGELVKRLDEINFYHPQAVLDDYERGVIKKKYSAGLPPGPTPELSRFIFESIFCVYMAERFVIEPA